MAARRIFGLRGGIFMITLQENAENFHTVGHVQCPACEQALNLKFINALSPELTFNDAFDVWIDSRMIDLQGFKSDARYISDRSIRDLKQAARAAGKFFGRLKLKDIHVGHLREYQRARAVCDKACGNWEQRAGGNLIRREVATVVRVMKAAGAWGAHHEEVFEPLATVVSGVPRAM